MASECACGGACRGPMASGDLLRYRRRETDMEVRDSIRMLHLGGNDKEHVVAILGISAFEYNRLTGR